jgi:glycosyltransferase involved in cell wall biosynthesis
MKGMDRPTSVSVITVVLNNAAGFNLTRQSILGQDHPQLEWIVVDGGSTDGTAEAIRKCEPAISQWTSEPDRGIYDAMNKGLAKANGEWVNFMNAGDVFAFQDTVSRVMAGDLEGVGVVYGDSIAAYPAAQVLKRAGTPEMMVRGMVFSHQSAFVRKKLAMEKGFDLSFQVAADYEMMFRLFSGGAGFKHLPFPVAVVDVSGVSNRKMVQSAREHFAIASKYRNLSLVQRIYHVAYIGWVALVTAGYKILPVGLMHRISNITSKTRVINRLSFPARDYLKNINHEGE